MRLRIAIALIQILGGGWGVLASLSLYRQVSGLWLLLPLAFTFFFGLVGYAGVLLWKGHPWGTGSSMFVQGMQLPVLLTSGPSYLANAGLGLRLTVDSSWNAGFYFHFGSQFHFSWQSDRTATTLGINLVAAVLMYLIVQRLEDPPSPLGLETDHGAA